MKKSVVDTVIKDFLEEKGFDDDQIDEKLKEFHSVPGVKEEEEDDPKVRHGTTCFGFITEKAGILDL